MYTTKNIQNPDNPDFTRLMLELFINTINEFIIQTKLSLINKDLFAINQQAHKIKASLKTMEINHIIPALIEIENAHSFDEALITKLERLIENLNLVREQIEADLKFTE